MKKVAVVTCGAYLDAGYGCPGEWRCLKAANLSEGKFAEKVELTHMVRCECPGRSVVPNVGMAIKLSEVRPDVIHLSSCLANAKPGCPYFTPDELAAILTTKTGLPVVQGTHEYH